MTLPLNSVAIYMFTKCSLSGGLRKSNSGFDRIYFPIHRSYSRSVTGIRYKSYSGDDNDWSVGQYVPGGLYS
jgi:hypothetical protein